MTTANPFTSWLDEMAKASAASGGPHAQAWADEWHALAKRMTAWPKVVEALRNRKTFATPFEVAATEGPVRLLRFSLPDDEPQPKVRHATPMLFVFALVNRPYVLDILPHKSVIRQYLRAGFDCWMVDWGVPTAAEATKTLHDYIEGHLHRMVKTVLGRTGQDDLHLFGYCMGGTMSAIYASLHQDLVRTLTLLAAPIDWSRGDCLLKAWSSAEVLDPARVADAFGLVPSGFLGSSFNMLKPIDNNIRKWMGFMDRMDDERFLEEFAAMEGWVNDNIPLSGAVYRDFVGNGLQRNLLVKGEFPLGSRTIDLADVTCPLLNIVATADHLVPKEQSEPANAAVGSDDTETLTVKAGHIGLAVGSKAHKEMWPAATEWTADRSVGRD